MLQSLDFRLQFEDRARRRRLIKNLLLGGLNFVVGSFLEVLHIVSIKRWRIDD